MLIRLFVKPRLLVPILGVSLVAASLYAAYGPNYCTRDFFAFWAAARQFLYGGDPYIIESYPVALTAGCPVHFPYAILNPPLGLPLLVPFAAFSFQVAVSLYLLSAMAIYFSIPFLCRSMVPRLERNTEGFFLSLLPLLTFTPFFVGIYIGQISIYVALALTLFLLLFLRGNYRSAGFCLSFTLIKPHLLYLLYTLIAVHAIRDRRFRGAMTGFGAGVTGLGLSALLFNPSIFDRYLYALFHVYRTDWITPTVGAWIRWYLPEFSHAWVTAVCVGVVGMIAYRWRAAKETDGGMDALCFATALSLATTPYLWTYDFALYTPLLFILAHRYSGVDPRRQFNIVLVLLLCNVLLVLKGFQSRYDVWYPWAVLALWYTQITSRQRCETTQ